MIFLTSAPSSIADSASQTMPVSQGRVKFPKDNTNKAFICSDWADTGISLVETMNIRSALNEFPFVRIDVIFVSMKRSKSAQRIQVLGYMAVFFLLITSLSADEQVIYPEACSPQNTYCYFERYGNIKLPRIEPIQASKIRLFFSIYYKLRFKPFTTSN